MSEEKTISLPSAVEMFRELVSRYNEPRAVTYFYTPFCKAMGKKTMTVGEFTQGFISAVKTFFLTYTTEQTTRTSFLLHVSVMLMGLVKDQGVLLAMIPEVCRAIGPQVDPQQFRFKVGDKVLNHQPINHVGYLVMPETIGTVTSIDMSSAAQVFLYGGQMTVQWEGHSQVSHYYFNALPPHAEHTNGWETNLELVSEREEI